MRCCLRTALAAVCLVLLSPPGLSAQGVSYVYDALGRLIAVTDPTGDTALYEYDAVGNVVSIVRRTSSVVSLIHFAPASGPIGTTVTLYGTGFSATPGLNTVTFNGVAASISGGSSTHLVVVVPSGATTGVVGVTAPTGSASSGADFVVEAGPAGPPTISGFTPTLADAHGSVTITGTGFAPGAIGSGALFNVAQATTLPGSSSTTLLTTVPQGATSGRISVTTASGQAQSVDDFYVPPPGVAASDVIFTQRMTVGSALAVPIPTAHKVGLVLFDATLGQRLNLKLQPGPSVEAAIRRPGGTTFAAASAPGVTAFTDVVVAPTSGTYAILVDPMGTGTGTSTLTLYEVPPDVSGTIPVNGTSTGVSITTPGQNARLTFGGAPGQRVSLKASGGPTGPVRLTDPAGTVLASGAIAIVPTFIEPVQLGSAGTHAVALDPTGGNTGSVTLNLYDVPADLSGAITPGGAPVSLALSTPGQNGTLSFTGTSGQRVSLRISSGSPAGSVTILNPDATTFRSATMGAVQQFIDASELTQTGTFTIPVDPSSFNAGTVTLTLYDVPADASGSLTVNGGSLAVTISTPGQNGQFTFAGTSAQAVTVRVTGNTIGLVTVRLLRPDGSQQASSTSLAGSFNLAQQTLASSGTYTVVVDPSTVNTGGLTLSVTNP